MKIPMGYLAIIAALLPICTARADCRVSSRSVAKMATEAPPLQQAQLGNRFSWPWKPDDCVSGEVEFVVYVNGRRFPAPCQFISQTSRHLKLILLSQDTKHPLARGADHAHLAVTAEIWDEKYRHLPAAELLPVVLRDPSLVAIYHSDCHCSCADRENADRDARELDRRRHFLGFYDGRAMANLPDRGSNPEPTREQYYRTFAWFSIAAHRSGAPVRSAGEKSAVLELFLDDDRAAAPVPQVIGLNATVR